MNEFRADLFVDALQQPTEYQVFGGGQLGPYVKECPGYVQWGIDMFVEIEDAEVVVRNVIQEQASTGSSTQQPGENQS